MATSIDELKQWIKRGQEQGASHLIVMCDTYDWEDYPVYVMPGMDARKTVEEQNKVNAQKLMEVYNLSKDIEAQLSQHRCMEF